VGVIAAAVVAGLVLGRARGGRWRHAAEHRLLGWPLLLSGIGLQLAAGPLAGDWGLACLLLSYLLLVVFVVLNLARTGMPVVLAGLVLNAVVIGVNGGMPVRRSAVVAAGGATRLAGIHLSGKHHLAGPGDHWVALGDVIPVRPFHEVVAAGDVVLAAGLVVVLASLLQPPRPAYVPRHRRPRSGAAARLTWLSGSR
jgi:hypothetical protein